MKMRGRRITKWLLYSGIVMSLILLTIIVYAGLNIKSFEQELAQENVYLLEDAGKILAGARFAVDLAAQPEYLTEMQVKGIIDKGYSERIIVINIDAFAGVDTADMFGREMSHEFIVAYLRGQDHMQENQGFIERDLFREKGIAFTILITKMLKGSYTSKLIIEEYKKGNIKIYPDTWVTKLLYILP